MIHHSLRDYWRDVRELQTELEQSHPTGIYLAFVDRRYAGRIVLCQPGAAAKALIDSTHRRATEAEINSYLADQAIAGQTIGATQRIRWDPDHGTTERLVAVFPGKREQQ